MLTGAWGSRWFVATVGSFYDWAMQRQPVANAYLRLVVGDDARGLLGAMDAVSVMPDGSSILDVPCGGGITLRRLRPGQRARYVAADISPAMLARARRFAGAGGNSTVEFVECDITSMPFGDGEFDLVACFSGLHCLPDPAAAVREMARCVRPGGRVTADVALHGELRRCDAFMAFGRRFGVFGPPATFSDAGGWFTDAGLTTIRQRRGGALVYIDAQRPVQATAAERFSRGYPAGADPKSDKI
ncbi:MULTISPECIES: class I SAM-dependent methyltransferase [unclassified Mycobacterium]|uniref:class I SAM-dependent methyltransferase n=1 Tax=unclassified Mycobacterium TaxID=2642494 RepID=UPI000895DEC0|nr:MULTISPECIES: class I SAM-dependent methyltransferase [unclassified Mycobacterium]SEA03459.1 Methyltransferase domain-containing protein [Mycobacterium sp. 283mftsu]